DGSVGKAAGPDAEGESAATTIGRFLGEGREILYGPSGECCDRDAGRQPAGLGPGRADIKRFPRIADGRPEAGVPQRLRIARERSLIVLAQREPAVASETDP